MADVGGTIYAVGAVGSPYVKIGSTLTSVAKRIQELQIGHPLPLAILATVPAVADVRVIEKRVHRLLCEHHSHGEWFEIDMDPTRLTTLVARAIAGEEPARRPSLHAPYNIAPRLNTAWQQSGLTKAELAARAGMRWAQLHKLLTGQRPQVSADTVRRLAQVLGCTTDYLLGMDDAVSASEQT